jgi:hypothetical protein
VDDDQGFVCGSCGERHAGLPFAYGSDAPAYWRAEFEGDERSLLEQEICVINAEHFFVRANLVIPVVDADEDFEWGVWTTLSKANFTRMTDLWETPGRESEPPYFGWLSTQLPAYAVDTINLKTNVHTGPLGVRPHVELEPTDHPLAVEQRTGITTERVREIASQLLHPH